MIVFKKISYKNFLSVGNNPITIDLVKNKTTLIVGANGEGKSILLDALSFVLFGKPHRNVNKPQLVNSINGKNTLVELEFSIGHDEYRVVRGMLPGIFEIWKNKKMINQDSKSRDYQKILESNILKLNHKSFHQIVVLGSSSFVPFMQLPACHRREVIEDLLDISIFSKMNMLLKEKKAKVRDTVSSIEQELESLKGQIQLQKNHIRQLESISNENKARIQADLNAIESEIVSIQSSNSELMNEYSSIQKVDFTPALNQKKTLYEYEGNIKGKVSKIRKDIGFFHDNDSCSTCSQPISPDTKAQMIERLGAKLKQFEEGYEKLKGEIEKAEKAYEELSAVQSKRNSIFSSIESNNRLIESKKNEKMRLMNSLNEQIDEDGLMQSKSMLAEIIEKSTKKQDEKIDFVETSSYYGIIEDLLKDTGIKTKIIRQYLPIMNKLINEYLQIFDFFVSFTIDENFEEKIRSRHRDDFSYSSFSEGEKSRIDLALMFTWRQIAKLKNSTNTNLLILDETFDSSLDSDGVENLLKVLYTMDANTNTFIISHKSDVLDGKFANKLLFKKKNNFTEMHTSYN